MMLVSHYITFYHIHIVYYILPHTTCILLHTFVMRIKYMKLHDLMLPGWRTRYKLHKTPYSRDDTPDSWCTVHPPPLLFLLPFFVFEKDEGNRVEEELGRRETSSFTSCKLYILVHLYILEPKDCDTSPLESASTDIPAGEVYSSEQNPLRTCNAWLFSYITTFACRNHLDVCPCPYVLGWLQSCIIWKFPCTEQDDLHCGEGFA